MGRIAVARRGLGRSEGQLVANIATRLRWAMLTVAALLMGHASAQDAAPPGQTQVPLDLARAQVLSQDGVTVQLRVPTEEEVARLLGTSFGD